MRFRMLHAATTAVLLTLLASGCATPEPELPPQPTGPTLESLFGSEEDARLAAEKALRAYWEASAEVYQRPEKGADLLEALVTPERFDAEVKGADFIAKQEFTQEGSVAVDSVRIQGLLKEDEVSRLVITACADYNEHRLVRADGVVASRTAKNLKHLQQVTFHIRENKAGPPSLLFNDLEQWDERQC